MEIKGNAGKNNTFVDIKHVENVNPNVKEVNTIVNMSKSRFTAADRDMAEEIIVHLKRIENDYHIDLTKEMKWLRELKNRF